MYKTQKSLAVSLAEDVIRFVEEGKITPIVGSFHRFRKLGIARSFMARTMIDQGCEACALGSLLLASLLRRSYSGPWGPTTSTGFRNPIRYALSDAFDIRTLILIESAFEQKVCEPREHREAAVQAAAWGQTYPDVQERTLAIMRNLIVNQGQLLINTYQEARTEFQAAG